MQISFCHAQKTPVPSCDVHPYDENETSYIQKRNFTFTDEDAKNIQDSYSLAFVNIMKLTEKAASIAIPVTYA